MKKRIPLVVKTTAFLGVLAAGVLPSGVAPIGVLQSPRAWAQPADETLHEKTSKLLAQMRTEKMTAQQAFDAGLLTREILLYALGEPQVLGVDGMWNSSSQTTQWAQLLLDRFPELVEKPGEISDRARIQVARVLLAKRDARGAQIMENLLDNQSREHPEFAIVSSAISILANYYRETGQREKSIATSLRMQEFTTEPAWLTMHLFSAARTASAAGDAATAQRLYDQVIGYGDSWMVAQAYVSLADDLSKAGKWDEARAVLQKPVGGEKAAAARVLLNQQLSQSYYERGEWDEARKWAQAAVDAYDALPEAEKEERLKWTVEAAQRLPQQIAQWQKKPVQIYTEQITVRVAKDEAEPVRTYFNVNSYRAFTVKAASSNPNIKTWPLQPPGEHRSSSYQMVGVEIAPTAFPKEIKSETEAEITVSFEEFPDTVFRIPVKIELREDGDKNEDD